MRWAKVVIPVAAVGLLAGAGCDRDKLGRGGTGETGHESPAQYKTVSGDGTWGANHDTRGNRGGTGVAPGRGGAGAYNEPGQPMGAGTKYGVQPSQGDAWNGRNPVAPGAQRSAQPSQQPAPQQAAPKSSGGK